MSRKEKGPRAPPYANFVLAVVALGGMHGFLNSEDNVCRALCALLVLTALGWLTHKGVPGGLLKTIGRLLRKFGRTL